MPNLNWLTRLNSRGTLLLGADAGVVAGLDRIGIVLTDDIGSGDFDLLITFTTPTATMEHLTYCQSQGHGGWSLEQQGWMRASGVRLPRRQST